MSCMEYGSMHPIWLASTGHLCQESQLCHRRDPKHAPESQDKSAKVNQIKQLYTTHMNMYLHGDN